MDGLARTGWRVNKVNVGGVRSCGKAISDERSVPEGSKGILGKVTLRLPQTPNP